MKVMKLQFASDTPNAVLPTDYGDFQIYSLKSNKSTEPNLVLWPVGYTPINACLVRLHSECLTGDVFGSKRCDCGFQLKESLRLISKEGGVFIYLRQEGRGIGIHNKIKAYALQDQGQDTVEANHTLGFDTDQRDYEDAVQILNDMAISNVKLITNNPAKSDYLNKAGINILEIVPMIKPIDDFNKNYLETKRRKMGHVFPGIL